MATVAERAVIEAARYHVSRECLGGWAPLVDALAALDAVEATTTEPAKVVELDITWGEVVSGDLMLSAKTGKWMEALEVRPRGSDVCIRMTGGGKAVPSFTRAVTTPVKVRRTTAMADAIDALTMTFSGPA